MIFQLQNLRKEKILKNQNKNKSVIFHRKYSIQEVIKSNQVILIQVVKEERGNKGADRNYSFILSWKILCTNA